MAYPGLSFFSAGLCFLNRILRVRKQSVNKCSDMYIAILNFTSNFSISMLHSSLFPAPSQCQVRFCPILFFLLICTRNRHLLCCIFELVYIKMRPSFYMLDNLIWLLSVWFAILQNIYIHVIASEWETAVRPLWRLIGRSHLETCIIKLFGLLFILLTYPFYYLNLGFY